MLGLQDVQDLGMFRKPAFGLLRENTFSVHIHFKHASGAFDEFRVDPISALNCGRQTGGLG